MSILKVANITDTQFVGNSVVGDTDGGALFIGAESNVVITNTLFDGNKSLTSTGGAIATRQGDLGNNKDAKLEIVNSVFKGSSSKALFNFAPRELLSITQAKFLCKRLFRVLLKSFPRTTRLWVNIRTR